jgi:spore maturation protein CgeB
MYRHAKVVPSIGEPYAWEIGSFYERPFKVLGSGGLTITDTQPSYRELFTEDELLVPHTVQEYHDLMNIALVDEDWNRRWRERGIKAVLSRHTYRHRAEEIVRLLNE